MKGNKILKIAVLTLFFLLLIGTDVYAAEGVFETIRQRTTTFASQLRVLAYVISCFGIVMFTFVAITGKINFKHLSYICMSLFILSAAGALIDYFTGGYTNLSSEFNDTYTKAAPDSSFGS